MARKKRSPVSKKISILRHEGEKQSQAVAAALSMKRAGRLTSEGKYIHVKRKKRSGGR